MTNAFATAIPADAPIPLMCDISVVPLFKEIVVSNVISLVLTRNEKGTNENMED
jgi:hypothetical protein